MAWTRERRAGFSEAESIMGHGDPFFDLIAVIMMIMIAWIVLVIIFKILTRRKKNKLQDIKIERRKYVRFTAEKELGTQYETTDGTIFVQRSVVLLDHATGKYFLQMKLCNLGREVLKSVYLRIQAFNDAGDLLGTGGYIEISCTDVMAGQNEIFGTKNLAALSGIPGSIAIEEVKAVHADGRVRSYSAADIRSLGNAVLLKSVLAPELQDYLEIEKDLIFRPQPLTENLQRCVCGGLIRNHEKCPLCGRDFAEAKEAADPKRIKERRDQFFSEKEKEETEKRNEEEISKALLWELRIAAFAGVLGCIYRFGAGAHLFRIPVYIIYTAFFVWLIISLLKKQELKEHFKEAFGISVIFCGVIYASWIYNLLGYRLWGDVSFRPSNVILILAEAVAAITLILIGIGELRGKRHPKYIQLACIGSGGMILTYLIELFTLGEPITPAYVYAPGILALLVLPGILLFRGNLSVREKVLKYWYAPVSLIAVITLFPLIVLMFETPSGALWNISFVTAICIMLQLMLYDLTHTEAYLGAAAGNSGSAENVISVSKFCPRCGEKVLSGEKFCARCGAKLIK